MHDQLHDGRRLRVLTVVDQYMREALATEARGSFSANDVIDVLNRLSRSHREPAVIQVDNGTEFASRALDAWAYREDVRLDFSRPGKPTDNAHIECVVAQWQRSVGVVPCLTCVLYLPTGVSHPDQPCHARFASDAVSPMAPPATSQPGNRLTVHEGRVSLAELRRHRFRTVLLPVRAHPRGDSARSHEIGQSVWKGWGCSAHPCH